jgi:hypothetical protein
VSVWLSVYACNGLEAFLVSLESFNKLNLSHQSIWTYHRSTLTSPRPSFVLSVPAAMNVSRHANAEMPAPRAKNSIHQNKSHRKCQGSSRKKKEPTISHLHSSRFGPLVPASDCTVSTRRDQSLAIRSFFQTCDALVCLGYRMHKREV